MSRVEGSFTLSAQSSQEILISPGNRINVQVYGSWTGAVIVYAREAGGLWTIKRNIIGNGNYTCPTVIVPTYYKIYSATVSTGTCKWVLEEGNETTVVDDEWDDLRFPAQAINPIGQTAAAGVDTTESAFPGTLLFDSTTPEICCGVAQMSHRWRAGTNIRPHIHWAKSTSASGGVVWHLYYRIINRQAAPEDWVGPITGVDVLTDGNTANAESITTFGEINMNGRSPSTMVAWRLYRMPEDEADTYAADARLYELDFHFRVGSQGTGLEFIY